MRWPSRHRRSATLSPLALTPPVLLIVRRLAGIKSEASGVVRAARPSYDALAHRRAFGERVRALRQEQGWTQERLAEQCGLDRSYVAGIESGARNPTLDVIWKVATGLAVPAARLFEPEHDA